MSLGEALSHQEARGVGKARFLGVGEDSGRQLMTRLTGSAQERGLRGHTAWDPVRSYAQTALNRGWHRERVLGVFAATTRAPRLHRAALCGAPG